MDLLANPIDPTCRWCRGLRVEERFDWLSEYTRLTGAAPAMIEPRHYDVSQSVSSRGRDERDNPGQSMLASNRGCE